MSSVVIDRARLGRLMDRELATFAADNPVRSLLHERASDSLLDGVPMNWMVQLGRRLSAVRRDGDRGAFPGRRRPRLHRLLPRRHRCDGRSLACPDGRRGRAPAAARDHPDAADRGRDRRRARSCAGGSGSATGSSRSRRPTRTGSRSGLPGTSPAGPRSSSTTTTTTARSTRRSPRSTSDGRVVAEQGQHRTGGRPGPDHPGRASSTTSRRSSGRWPTATSRRSSSSRP